MENTYYVSDNSFQDESNSDTDSTSDLDGRDDFIDPYASKKSTVKERPSADSNGRTPHVMPGQTGTIMLARPPSSQQPQTATTPSYALQQQGLMGGQIVRTSSGQQIIVGGPGARLGQPDQPGGQQQTIRPGMQQVGQNLREVENTSSRTPSMAGLLSQRVGQVFRPNSDRSDKISEVLAKNKMSHQGLAISSTRSLNTKVDEKKTKGNINTKFEWESKSKSLKHWILEKCVETLKIKIEEIHETKVPGQKWTFAFGVEPIWKIHGAELEEKGLTEGNVRKSVERVVALKKAPTGMGDIGETPAALKPTRQENSEDWDEDAYTKSLVEEIVGLRSILEEDVKKLKDIRHHAPKKNPNNYETSEVTEQEDVSSHAKVPVGIKLAPQSMVDRKRKALEIRSEAAFGTDKRNKQEPKEKKPSDTFSELASSLKDLTAMKIEREREKIEEEKKEREERKKKEEERTREKSTMEENFAIMEKNLEEKMKKQINSQFEGMKDYMKNLFNK